MDPQDRQSVRGIQKSLESLEHIRKVLTQKFFYRMAEGQETPPPPVEETVDIADVEEGSGEVAEIGSKRTMSYNGTLKEDVTTFK